MLIGVVNETGALESRVALTPTVAAQLVALQHEVVIESGAGAHAFFSDEDYRQAGATVTTVREQVYAADVFFKLTPFAAVELEQLKSEALVICFFQVKDELKHARLYQEKSLSLISMNYLPRISRAQNMDALSSQSNIAGYKAVIVGANSLTKYMPLLMTAAGTIKPARVLVLGTGVAGLSAIAQAKRMGAQVFAYDVRAETKEQVESLGAQFVTVDVDEGNHADAGGYAKAVSQDVQLKQQTVLSDNIKRADLVISTALIPEQLAPLLITQAMVEIMSPGSVIMDLAAANGGNCELTQSDQIIVHHQVIINGMTNLVSSMPTDASELYARNVFNLFTCVFSDDGKIARNDEVVNAALVFLQGAVLNSALQKALEGER
jgi:H+-translocating NAD(P) transhydrogenase subunit alpha